MDWGTINHQATVAQRRAIYHWIRTNDPIVKELVRAMSSDQADAVLKAFTEAFAALKVHEVDERAPVPQMALLHAAHFERPSIAEEPDDWL
jgi:hypothetical protein